MNAEEYKDLYELRRQSIYEATSNFSSAHAQPPLYRMRYLCLSNSVDLCSQHEPTEFVQLRSDLSTFPAVLWNCLNCSVYAKSLSYEHYQGFGYDLGDSPEGLMVQLSEFPYPKAVLFIATVAADIVYNLEANSATYTHYNDKWQEAIYLSHIMYEQVFGRMDEVWGVRIADNFGIALEKIGINTSSKYLDYVLYAYGFSEHVWYQSEYFNHELDPGYKLAELPIDSEEEVH